MNNIHIQIASVRTELLKIQKQATNDINEIEKRGIAKDLQLHPVKSGNTWQYYLVNKTSKGKDMYLPKSQRIVASEIAKRDYALKVMSKTNEWIEILDKAEELLQKIPAESAASLHQYPNLHDARTLLIKPYKLSDAEYIQYWKTQQYRQNKQFPEHKIYETKDGEYVRSKSEKIIADFLYDHEIPYRYEASFKVNRDCIIHPDFTVLNIRNRTEIYLEHLGMLDTPHYANTNVERLNSCISAGLIPGKNLFFTYETSAAPLNMIQLKAFLKSIAE